MKIKMMKYYSIKNFFSKFRIIKKLKIPKISIKRKNLFIINNIFLLVILYILIEMYLIKKYSINSIIFIILFLIKNIFIFLSYIYIKKYITKEFNNSLQKINQKIDEYDIYTKMLKLKYEEEKYKINKLIVVYGENEYIDFNLNEYNSLLIGKKGVNNFVDVDLSTHEYSFLVSKVHSVLNKVNSKWFLEDLNSKNGCSIKRKNSKTKEKIESNKQYIIYKGDELYISVIKVLVM